MSSVTSVVTLTEQCFPDITGKTIGAWGLVSFATGAYVTGGIPFGLITFADARTIDFNGFLKCDVWGEDPITASVGGYSYHYSPAGDVLQLLLNGTEVTNGAAIPAAVLNDTVLFHATWNRTVVLG